MKLKHCTYKKHSEGASLSRSLLLKQTTSQPNKYTSLSKGRKKKKKTENEQELESRDQREKKKEGKKLN